MVTAESSDRVGKGSTKHLEEILGADLATLEREWYAYVSGVSSK